MTATVQWITTLSSRFSVETYELEIRLAAQDGQAEGEWVQVAAALTGEEHPLPKLSADTLYDARVRGSNARGAGPWCEANFRTKQQLST